ncbi:MAG TPA: type II secretion system protein M [Candidatus Aquabacterium excrementipullorum]|nr:type II secretion system protein M [Candidatus Aquabacterium excrementipullorum]
MAEQTASLNEMRAQLTARWAAMAPRERRMVTVMAWLLGITLVFLLGVRPAWKTLQQTPVQLREVNAVLEDMQRQANEVKTLRQMPVVPPAQAEAALRSATERLGESGKLRLQPDRAVVTFTKVAGADLAQWLAEVRSSARARPVEANFAQVEPGVYSGTISVVLPGLAPVGR